MVRLLLGVLVCLACLAASAYGLYEDQAGAFDWYKQQIGLVKHASFHSVKPRVCVSTRQSVLGCLNLRDGSVPWRKLLSEPAAAFLEHQNLMITVSSGIVRAFDYEGFQKWERRLVPEEQVRAGAPAALTIGAQDADSKPASTIVATCQGYVKVLEVRTGKEQPAAQAVSEFSAKQVFTAGIIVCAYSPGDVTIGSVWGSESWSSPKPLSALAAGSAKALAVVSQDGQDLCVSAASGGALTCTPLADLQLPAGLALPLQPGAAKLHATSASFLLASAVAGQPGAALLAVAAGPEGSGSTVRVVQAWSDVLGVSAAVSSDKGEVVGLVTSPAPGSVALRVVSSESGETVLQEAAVPRALGGERHTKDSVPAGVASAFLGTYRKKDRTDGFRLLLALSDGRLVLLQQGVLVWSREEALATVTSSVFADLPAPRAAAGSGLDQGPKLDFKTRLRAQLLGVKVQVKLNTPDEAAELLALRQQLSDKTQPVRDVNGFRKLLLATTGAGKLVALHNGDGRVMWARNYAPADAPLRALRWRIFHDTAHAPQVVLLHGGAKPAASVVDAHTGAELSRQDLPFIPDKVVVLHERMHDGSAEQSVYLLVQQGSGAQGPRVHLLPDSPAARSHFAEAYRSLYLYESDGVGSSTLRGYTFDADAAAAAVAGKPIIGIPAWQVDFQEPILTMVARDPSEPIQSSVKVLADRSIKYRYLNPSTLFVATGTPAGTPGSTDVDLQAVTGYLIDTVTGRILHRQVQTGGRGPVSAAFTENLVLMMYWDASATKYVATSMELYDASARAFSVLDYLFNPNATRPVSSYNATPVEVLSQVFWVGGYQPRSIAVTRTQQGITIKQFLITTMQDQVYSLDPRFVDPRRPKRQKLTPEEIEDRLIPYNEQLPLVPQFYATLDKQVLGLSSVVVEPSRLESTCLVFMHGVDLFYTRLAPARAFDSLDDDFNYALLVTALIGLAVGAVFMHYAVKQAGLKQKWK